MSAIPGLVKTGADIYAAKRAQDAARKARKEAEEATAAAQADLEAAKKAQAEQLRLQTEAAAIQAQGGTAALPGAAAIATEKILGIPRDIALLGGVGIVAAIGLFALLK